MEGFYEVEGSICFHFQREDYDNARVNSVTRSPPRSTFGSKFSNFPRGTNFGNLKPPFQPHTQPSNQFHAQPNHFPQGQAYPHQQPPYGWNYPQTFASNWNQQPPPPPPPPFYNPQPQAHNWNQQQPPQPSAPFLNPQPQPPPQANQPPQEPYQPPPHATNQHPYQHPYQPPPQANQPPHQQPRQPPPNQQQNQVSSESKLKRCAIFMLTVFFFTQTTTQPRINATLHSPLSKQTEERVSLLLT